MGIQEAYKQKMSAQLNEWSAQINLFEAKVENAAADLKVQRAETLRHLRAKQHVASEQLLELGEASGFIRYRRGHITVVDRAGLEDHVCECYAVVKKEFARLLSDVQQPHGTPAVMRVVR